MQTACHTATTITQPAAGLPQRGRPCPTWRRARAASCRTSSWLLPTIAAILGTALVAGAASGIGEATAVKLAASGWTVATEPMSGSGTRSRRWTGPRRNGSCAPGRRSSAGLAVNASGGWAGQVAALAGLDVPVVHSRSAAPNWAATPTRSAPSPPGVGSSSTRATTTARADGCCPTSGCSPASSTAVLGHEVADTDRPHPPAGESRGRPAEAGYSGPRGKPGRGAPVLHPAGRAGRRRRPRRRTGGTDEQKERWLRGIAVGDLVFSESISEKNAGSSFKTIPGVGDHPLDTLEVGDHVVVGSKAWTHSTVAGSKAWTHSTSACAAVLSRTTSRSRPKAGPSPKPHHTPREPPRGSIGATAPPRPGPGSLSRQSSGVSSVSGVTPLKFQSR